LWPDTQLRNRLFLDEGFEDPKEWQDYKDGFKPNQERLTQVGPSFQVSASAIPKVHLQPGKHDRALQAANKRIQS